ncbi:MAG: radical SAM protein [Nitrospirae bacterium]|nr:radical SAM protein [Nitrospirota bacterium]
MRAVDFAPAYVLLAEKEFLKRLEALEEILKSCHLCPRNCKVDRTAKERGFCKTGDMPYVSSYGPHFGEERPLVGRFGSGTIFFGRCNLGCIFCQNWSISHLGEGSEISFERLSEIMLELKNMGCHNINLVTPTHQMPMILKAIMIAKGKGLNLPIVYNTGGYDSLETIKLLDGIIDIYMPDFKYWDPLMSEKYSKAKDYPETARTAIKEMHRQVGDLIIKDGIAQRGLLVRHLVLPQGIAGTKEVVTFIASEISKNTYINIMEQYHPCYKAFEEPPLDRTITKAEFEEAVRFALSAGLKRLSGITVP